MTLLNPRFVYEPIRRTTENGSRLYTTPAGDRVPSVTTVLSATTPTKKKQALQNWRNAVGHQQAQQITNQAANRGTRMHSFLENYVKNGALDERPSNPGSWASHLMAQTVIDRGLINVTEIWGIEIPLFMPQMYAGTSDSVGVHCGSHAIIDYKQSNRRKTDEQLEDYKLQLVAYALAHNELHGTQIRKGVNLIAIKPATDRDGFLKLAENGEPMAPPDYQESVIEGQEFDHWSDQWWQRLEQFYVMRSRGEI